MAALLRPPFAIQDVYGRPSASSTQRRIQVDFYLTRWCAEVDTVSSVAAFLRGAR